MQTETLNRVESQTTKGSSDSSSSRHDQFSIEHAVEHGRKL
jgi:hypothetical protein